MKSDPVQLSVPLSHLIPSRGNSRKVKPLRETMHPIEEAEHFVEDTPGYEVLGRLLASKLDALVDILIVDCITAHMQRPTGLVQRLAEELKINLRDHWRPDAAWLSSFRKIQLAHLIVELKSPVYAPAPETKKSALVEMLAQFFTDASEGKLEDKQLAERANSWLPSDLRTVKEEAAKQHTANKRV